MRLLVSIGATSAMVLSTIGWLPFAGIAFAQTTMPQVFFDLFAGDSATPTPDGAQRFKEAAGNAQDRGQCPKAKVKVVMKSGNPSSQQALAQARRDALVRLLGDQARHFLFETEINRADDRVEIDSDALRDQEYPDLRVIWTPEPGTKRNPGEKITARATAHDNANRWQTGVEGIDFIVRPYENNEFFGFHQWPQRPQRCEDVPPPRTADAIYTVPANPPPIVRLEVCTKDFVGNGLCVMADYPTGEWYGTLTNPGGMPPHQFFMSADFALNRDSSGNLTGTMVGRTDWIANTYLWQPARPERGTCFASTKRPHSFRISLVGSHTEGRSLKVFIENIEETPMIINHRCPGSDTDAEAANLGFRNYLWYDKALLGTPGPLGDGELRADGTREYKWEGPPQRTVTVTLRRARN